MNHEYAVIIVCLTTLFIYTIYVHSSTEQRVKSTIRKRNSTAILNAGNTQRVELSSPHVRIGPSPVQGNGVFATRKFDPGDIIEICPILRLKRDSVHAIINYVFDDPMNPEYAVFALGYGSLYNHSSDGNAKNRLDASQRLLIIAQKTINVGDEIMFDYGSKYWEFQQMLQKLRKSH